jgi:hypothetical protein
LEAIMKMMTKGLVSIALLAVAFTVGCGSGTGSEDAGTGGTTGSGGTTGTGGAGGANPCPGVATLFGLSTGDSCFDVMAIAAGESDGCMLGVADPYNATTMEGVIGSALLVNYDMSTATLTVGTNGSLGTGAIMCNEGTLLRENMPTLTSMPACTWHQSDASMVSITATNEFDISVTEAQNQFAGCSAANMPASGSCTSTWTWHMKKNATKTPPGCN